MQGFAGAPGWVVAFEGALILTFIILFFLVPRGVLRTSSVRKPNPQSAAAVQAIGEETRAAELNVIDTLILPLLNESKESRDLTKDHFAKKIFSAIDYAIKRHDWYEDQRSRMLQVTLALTTAVLATVALIARSDTSLAYSQKLVLFFLGVLTLVSVIRQVLLYNAEFDADRPYRLISDIRFWYWRNNLPNLALVADASKEKELAKEVAGERQRFIDRASENVSWKASVREDLEQLFILHCLQRYRAESLGKMRWALTYFTITVAAHLLFFILVTWTVDGAP